MTLFNTNHCLFWGATINCHTIRCRIIISPLLWAFKGG